MNTRILFRLSCVLLVALLPLVGHASVSRRMVDVEVIDRDSGERLQNWWNDDQSYVAGTPGHRYGIRLRNLSGERVLAVVSVDGVNVVSGETAAPDQAGYVLQPWQTTEIDGWRKNLSQVAAFEFTALPDSYASRTGRPFDVGVIGVAVFRERARWRPFWRGDEEIGRSDRDDGYRHRKDSAASEPTPATADSGAGRSKSGLADRSSSGALAERSMQPGTPLGTGHGDREYSGARQVDFERASRDPVQIVSLRYDSYRNLVAMGVIPRDPRGPRYRDPNPFPAAFVPDPPRLRYR